jgi:tRNA(fMet)-specific endonuclease VapC
VVSKVASADAGDLAISCFNLAELLYGAYNSQYVSSNLERVRFLESRVTVLDFDRRAMNIYAESKAMLKKAGSLIDDFDILIAAVAISNNLILVTNNEKHFARIPDIQIENWLK